MSAMTVAGHRYELESRGVEAALEGVLPEPIQEHFVVINGRRWPPKQVLALVTGLKTAGTLARVNLTVTDGTEEFSWDAPVWFCDPWPHPFGLAGLEGFLHHFIVTIRAYDGYLDIEPQP